MFADIYRGKKVLVTGHTGFKGAWLTRWLLELGAEVAGYAVDIPTEPSLFEILGLEGKIRHHLRDIRDLDALRKVFADEKPDIVFHLASQALVRRAYKNPRETFEVNAMGMANLLECLLKSPQTRAAVLITSDKCYENVEWEFGYRETDRLGGKDPYSASKACAEIIASSYMRSFFGAADAQGLQVATSRAGNVIGGGDWAADRIVPDCARAWMAKETPVIRSPKATRPWQHVLEPLSGYLWLGASLFEKRSGLNHEAFNFGPASETNRSVQELIETMRGFWPGGGWKLDPQAAALAGKEAGLLKLCCDKALHRLAWLPTLTFGETAEMTAAWYKNYADAGKSASIADFTAGQLRSYVDLAKRRERVWSLK